MASTYSALKIELIGTGEQSGTWGTTTNNNLGNDALGEAITGSADVTFASANVTVTLTDTNASQTARNLRLNLIGTTGGARDLILGSGCQIEKLYLINNTCADAITVKNTSGTGIAVAAGKSMFVYNNGTNVVDAVTHLSSLTLGSALPIASGGTGSTSTTFVNAATNITGTLPIANGGTGTTSTTFTNLTTNVTGTLPIANGGTGSTSTTFVNAATNITGTLPIANGGTGTTSTTFTNLTTNVTGTLPVANGGTGASTLTSANVILGAGTSAVTFVAPGSSGNLLTSNGSTWTSAAPSGGGGLGGTTVFTSSGTFTIPTGKTVVKVTVVGGGNSGGNAGGCSSAAIQIGAGGGAGGAAIKYLTGLTPGNTLTVTRGAAGGGTSSVSSGTQTITTISATGGTVGGNINYVGHGGAGGSGTNGDWNIQGGRGGTAFIEGSASSCPPTFTIVAGTGGNSILGFGGAGGFNSDRGGATAPLVGQLYGSGGGGGAYTVSTGAAGANGIIIFEY